MEPETIRSLFAALAAEKVEYVLTGRWRWTCSGSAA
jgi:hypothetical protein